MPSSSSNSAVVLELAEEFLERYRQGQRPCLKEYTDKHPELAAEIREVFPAMAMMENIALGDESLTGAPIPASALPMLQRLGDYRIIREVGRGGMGVVYEAEQVSLGRHVALKVLPNNTLVEPRHKRRFEREAKAAAKLHHTNIVPVFGVGEEDGVPYYAMQFIQGLGMNEVLEELKRLQGKGTPAVSGELPVSRRDLSAADMARSLMTGLYDSAASDNGEQRADAVPRAAGSRTVDLPMGGIRSRTASAEPANDSSGSISGSLSGSSVVLPGLSDDSKRSGKRSYWHSIATIGVQVAGALDYAHHQGILHRDIKPSNLLLDTRGTVWVTDFGLAKADDQQNLTTTGDILGTLRYMPPEAFEGRTDRRSDVYALGLTLYELLAMRPAFGEKDRHRLIKQVTSTEVSRLDAVNSAIPRDLVTIVHKAIDRDPAHRYPNAGELAADLRRYLDDEPIHARRLSTLERCGRWCRRNPLVACLIGAVALVTSVGFAATIHQMRAANANAAVVEQQHEDLQKKHALLESAVASLKEKEDELRGTLHGSRMSRVQLAWDNKNISWARELLAEFEPKPGEPDLRGWEWHFLNGKCNSHLRSVTLDEPITTDCHFSDDGNRFFQLVDYPDRRPTPLGLFGVPQPSAHNGKATVQVFDSRTGKTLRTFLVDWPFNYTPAIGTTGIRATICFNGDGTLVAMVNGGKLKAKGKADAGKEPEPGEIQLTVLDVGTGNELFRRRLDDPTRLPGQRVLLSPDGKFVAWFGGPGQPLLIWTVGDGGKEPVKIAMKTLPASLAFSPDGKRVVGLKNDDLKQKKIALWDTTTGIELYSWRLEIGTLTSLRFSPTGKEIALIGRPPAKADSPKLPLSKQEWKVAVFDAETGEEFPPIQWAGLGGNPTTAPQIQFSRDGTLLAGCSKIINGDPVTWVWDIETGARTHTLWGHLGTVVAVGASQDGHGFLSASLDGTIKEWDASGADVLGRTNLQGFEFVDQNTGRPMYPFGNLGLSGTAVNDDGTRLAIWKSLRYISTSIESEYSLAVCTAVGLGGSPSGQGPMLATTAALNPGNMAFSLIWGVGGGKGKGLPGGGMKGGKAGTKDGATDKEAKSKDGADKDKSGKDGTDKDGKAKVTEQEKKPPVPAPGPGGFGGPGFGPLGGATKGPRTGGSAIGIWDFKGRQVAVFEEHTGHVKSVALSPDGKLAASIAYLDEKSEAMELRVWNTSTAERLFVVRGSSKQSYLQSVFSRDGKRLALNIVVGKGKEVRSLVEIRDTGKDTVICATPEVEGSIMALQFSPDGKVLIGLHSGEGLYAWDATTGGVRWTIAKTGNYTSIAGFSSDGARVAATFNKRINFGPKLAGNKASDDEDRDETLLIDVASGKVLRIFRQNRSGGGSSSALSPDGKWLAVANSPTGNINKGAEIEVWDVARGVLLRTLKGHVSVGSMVFSPDSRRLVSADYQNDGELKIWDVATGHNLLSTRAGQVVTSVKFSPDGLRLILETFSTLNLGIAGGAGQNLPLVWDATPVRQRK